VCTCKYTLGGCSEGEERRGEKRRGVEWRGEERRKEERRGEERRKKEERRSICPPGVSACTCALSSPLLFP
jgi:hypothetical protein